ncbi:unnamed protein product [Rotaria sordida]|uniref:Kinesin light chain n=1 Tax=Rotaria sordida TaxID=392033 RepID=A0A819ZM99_9BILA|nr:unnamed protein product [Rotaria sordida]CAF4179488.1 unnamed protein product [Rotaria sordida]
MIVSNTLGQSTVPRIHHMSQLDSLYVLQQNKSEHTQWTQEWAKVKGIFTSIDAIYDIVKHDAERWEHDFISISVTGADLTGLDSSFMYTQLFKETLLEMEYKDKEKRELAEHCRILYSTDTKQLPIINEFEQDYDKHTPIWWYSRECFTYQMLNKALRTQEAENIIKMGFFLRDVHRHIEKLHLSQNQDRKLFTVYRGQEIDLQFLPPNHPYLAGTYGNIGQVHDKIGDYSKAFELHQKSLEIRQESLPPNHPSLAKTYYNIGEVHIHMGEFSKALEFHKKSLEIRQKSLPSNHPDLAQSYNSIGQIHDHMEEYSEALELHQKSLRIRQSLLPPNHPDIAEAFNSIGELHDHMGEYSKALEFHNESLKIQQKSLPPNHPDLARTYNNIGKVYDHMEQHAEAHPSYERAVEIGQHSLPENHPALELYRHNLTAVRKNL